MHLLFVLHAPRDPHGAVYNDTRRRAALLRARGHTVEILTPADLAATARLAPRWLPFVYPVLAARRLLGRGAPDLAVFHSYTGWFFRLVRALWPPARRTRMVTQFHGLEPLNYRAIRDEQARRGEPLPARTRLLQGVVVPAMARWSCRGSAQVLCLNRREERFLLDHRWSRPGRLSRLPNAVEPAFLAERSALRPSDRAGEEDRAAHLLFLGQWFLGKGIHYLVTAFERLGAERPDLALCCLGTRLPADVVRADFPDGLHARLRVLPAAEPEEVAAELRRADVFVFPSLAEGFSLALLEAMATGLPIVATRVGAAPDLLEDGVSALLVEPADAEALADAVRRLLDDPDLRHRLGGGARERAAEHTWERLAPVYVELLERTAGRDGGTVAREAG